MTRDGTSRCPRHKHEERRRYDEQRGTASARGYGARWQRLRVRVLREEPLCRFCAAENRVTAANEVDHIDGDSGNNDRANLRPLCKPCHSRRTIRDQGPNAGAGR